MMRVSRRRQKALDHIAHTNSQSVAGVPSRMCGQSPGIDGHYIITKC